MLPVPSYYGKLKEYRKQENLQLKYCRYINPDVKLRNYQAIGVLHIITATRFVLGDAPGLGKTVESLVAYAFLKERIPNLKLLVVAPKSALYQWKGEAEKFLVGVTAQVAASGNYRVRKGKTLTGTASRKFQLDKFFEDNTDILIVNYNTLEKEYETLIPRLGHYMVFLDEASTFKNQKTLTHRAVKETSRQAQRVVSLTATIIKNRLEEAFAIYDATVPGLFKNVTAFRNAFHRTIFLPVMRNGKKMKIPKVIGYKNLEIFRSYIDPYFLGRKKEDVATELPPLISKEVLLQMDSKQERVYLDALAGILKLEVETDGVREVQNYETFSAPYPGVLAHQVTGTTLEGIPSFKFKNTVAEEIKKFAILMYCQQISNSPPTIGVDAPSTKEEELLRLLKGELEEEKVIVFTNFKKQIDRFEKMFKEEEIKMTRITGNETSAQRDVNKNKFQDSNSGINVIFINRAGSESINLQAASTFIFFDMPWSYGDYQQLVGRAQRIGSKQTSILVLHFMNKGTIDEHVLKVLKSKKELVTDIFGLTGELSFNGDVVESLYTDLVNDAHERQKDDE